MLLGIDTCGGTGTIAIGRWSGEAIALVAQAELAGKTYSAQLVPEIQRLLNEHESSLHDLEAVVVARGPGSFTGVRIGMSTAKALAEALSIPLVAVSRLGVLAHKAGTEAAALDAGRGEFYFRIGESEALMRPEEIGARLDEAGADSPVTGGSLAVCEESAAKLFSRAVSVDPPTAADALLYSIPRLLAKDFDDVALIDGNYVRRSDAEIFAKADSGHHRQA